MTTRRQFLGAGTAGAALAFAPRAQAQWQPSQRYPDPAVKVLDPSFAKYRVNLAKVERLATGFRWCEGPVWFGDGRFLLWSDIPNDRIMRWDEETGAVSVFRKPSHNSNGNTRDRQGRLVTCEHDTRRVTRTEYDGSITVIAERFEGKRLNSPNDVVVKSDGSIWFTDPTYGILTDYEGHKAEMEQKGCFVYRVDQRSGKVRIVADDFVKPNGIAFAPDEKTLYVADSGFSHDPAAPHHIRAFDVSDDGRLSKGRMFFDVSPGSPDGLRLDVEGNVWTSCGDGVICIDPSGHALGKIRLPQTVSNLTFGGPRRNRLFITATKSLYAVYVATTGAQKP
jgi:gluconolactonase